jgi:hypothetical protein
MSQEISGQGILDKEILKSAVLSVLKKEKNYEKFTLKQIRRLLETSLALPTFTLDDQTCKEFISQLVRVYLDFMFRMKLKTVI